MGLQLYIYHGGTLQHCARNPDGMPIGRRNAVSNARIILQTRTRREFPQEDIYRRSLEIVANNFIIAFVLLILRQGLIKSYFFVE